MNVQIIFDSRYGNGQKVVQYLAADLLCKKHEVTMHLAGESRPADIPEADLYIFSAPTHGRRASRKIRKFIKKMIFPPDAGYVCLTTSGGKTFAVPGMCRMLDKKGVERAAEGLELLVGGVKGPLEYGWMDKIDGLIKEIESLKE